MDNKIIGRKINAALAYRNMKQKELAKAINVTDNTISYFCSGARVPTTEKLIQIAKALNVTTDYLLGLSDDPEKIPAAADGLCLSATSLKKLRYLARCDSPDRRYMETTNAFLESNLFNALIHRIYMRCQANIAEIVYNSTYQDGFDPLDPAECEQRNATVIEIANSGKYNSVVSSFLKQMVRFDQEQNLLCDDDTFALDCTFDRFMVHEIVSKAVTETFDSLMSELIHRSSRPIEKQLQKEALHGDNPRT